MNNKKYKLIAILRAKDEIDNIDQCLGKLSELVDGIVMLDNGSTDGTLERYKKYPKILTLLKTEGYHEGRDKLMLLNKAREYEPEWILWIDADEVFENNLTRTVLDSYMRSGYNRITFRLCHFWLDRSHCRFDGPYWLYSLHPQRSMWRNIPEATFKNVKLHNGDIQNIPKRYYLSPYRLKHYGYSDRSKMVKKYQKYIEEDKTGQRDYSHLDPSRPFWSYSFREFKSPTVNRFYIYVLKYIYDLFWLFERLRLKLIKF